MSARSASSAGGGTGGGRAGLTALLLVAAALGMFLLLRATPSAEPFDPRSGGPSGTRGLVLLLERLDADVSLVHTLDANDAADGTRVLVLRADLSDRQTSELTAFARAGGVVVWADPTIDPFSLTDIAGQLPAVDWTPSAEDYNVPIDECSIGALQHLTGVLAPSAFVFRSGGDSQTCFGDDRSSFVVATPYGKGWAVQLGDNEQFTNRFLRYADNAALATALLAPRAGAHVDILLGDGAAPQTSRAEVTEERTLFDLVRPSVWMALAQLAIAFIVFAAAVAIRPGRPVREPEQVPLESSELVVASGRLMQRAGHAQRAGLLLRSDCYRRLCAEHHLSPSTTVDRLDAIIAAQSTVAPGTVTERLLREVYDPTALLRLSNDLHDLELRARRPAPVLVPISSEGADT